MQPDLWRMSRKDGKATLVGAEIKRNVYVLTTHNSQLRTEAVANACPVKIIKVI
jgi:ferredoxin